MIVKIHAGEIKLVLRQLLAQYVPKSFSDRPAMGFGLRLSLRLSGPLRACAVGLPDHSRQEHDGFLYPESIQKAWQDHLKSKVDPHISLWNALISQVRLINENES